VRPASAGRARRGYTLVELLVAMSLTGVVVAMVSQWIVHEARARVSSDRRIDAEEAVSSLRNALFQDVHRGRILSLTRERMEILGRSASGDRDTIAWVVEQGRLSRRRGGSSIEPLAAIESLEISWEPVGLAGATDPFGSPWWRLDRDQNGVLETTEFDSVALLSVRILGKVPILPGVPSAVESLSVGIPTAGL